MGDIKIFENSEFGKIRTEEVNGKFYAVGVDVARALDYANPIQAKQYRITVKVTF